MKPQALPQRRPEWLRIRIRTDEAFAEVRRTMRSLSLVTVCEEARCPNIYECWSHRTATFMILGDVCTRRCGFCAVTSGRPASLPDPGEPGRVADAVRRLDLAHVVITSVDRDDLPDAGAGAFARVVTEVHRTNAGCAVEVLTPDFKGAAGALETVLGARPEVFSHNIETVPRLYRSARPGSRYEHSLGLLAAAANAREAGTGRVHRDAASPAPQAPSERRNLLQRPVEPASLDLPWEDGSVDVGERGARVEGVATPPAPSFRVKTGLMVGLGETDGELRETLREIRSCGVDVVTVGQYLQPTGEHLPVDRYVPPEAFAEIRAFALSLGFLHVEAGPLVRSSYRAHEHRPDPRSLHREDQDRVRPRAVPAPLPGPEQHPGGPAAALTPIKGCA